MRTGWLVVFALAGIVYLVGLRTAWDDAHRFHTLPSDPQIVSEGSFGLTPRETARLGGTSTAPGWYPWLVVAGSRWSAVRPWPWPGRCTSTVPRWIAYYVAVLHPGQRHRAVGRQRALRRYGVRRARSVHLDLRHRRPGRRPVDVPHGLFGSTYLRLLLVTVAAALADVHRERGR